MPDGWTPIALAARYGHVKIVNPNEPINQNGQKIYPICLAVKNGKKDIKNCNFLGCYVHPKKYKRIFYAFMLFYAIASVYKI